MNSTKHTAPTVTVQVRNVYGVNTIYPLCDAGRRFASIAGTKTLTERVLADIRALGFQVVEIPAASSLRRAA